MRDRTLRRVDGPAEKYPVSSPIIFQCLFSSAKKLASCPFGFPLLSNGPKTFRNSLKYASPHAYISWFPISAKLPLLLGSHQTPVVPVLEFDLPRQFSSSSGLSPTKYTSPRCIGLSDLWLFMWDLSSC